MESDAHPPSLNAPVPVSWPPPAKAFSRQAKNGALPAFDADGFLGAPPQIQESDESEIPGAYPRLSRIPLLDPGRPEHGVPYIVDVGHEGFNPGLCLHDGRKLLVWRKGWLPGRIWIAELDDHFRVTWSRPLGLTGVDGNPHDGFEDPRFLQAGGALWVVFSWVRGERSRQGLALLNDALEVADFFFVDRATDRHEKNWQFFPDDGAIRAVYSIFPHAIGLLEGNIFRFTHCTKKALSWRWGEPRGGTPPVRVGNEYFSFFHSSRRGIYVAGFYAFSAVPPFEVTRWPATPCLIARRDLWRTWGPSVVFPTGALFDGETWLLSYGWHDTHCCLAAFRHADLVANLADVRTHPPADGFSDLPGMAPFVRHPVWRTRLVPADQYRAIIQVTVFGESSTDLRSCLEAIRGSCPDSRLIVVSDGCHREEYSAAAHEHGARYVAGERLKVCSKGALFFERFFREALRDSGDFIFKVDVPTRFRRRLHRFPDAHFFGTLIDPDTDNEHIQAGCMVFSREFASQALSSGILLDPAYRQPDAWLLGKASREWVRAQPHDYLAEDCLMMHVARRLRFEWRHCPEIMSRACDPPAKQEFAITHP